MVGGWQHQLMFGCEAVASGQPGHLALGPADPADPTGTAGGAQSCPAGSAIWQQCRIDRGINEVGGQAHPWPLEKLRHRVAIKAILQKGLVFGASTCSLSGFPVPRPLD